MYKNPEQGPDNNLGEDNEKLFQKKKTDASQSAHIPGKPASDVGQADRPSRIYASNSSPKSSAPAYVNRRSASQNGAKNSTAESGPAAPTGKINTAAKVQKTPVQSKQAAPVSSASPRPVAPAAPAAKKREIPAYAARRAAESAGTPTPSQSQPAARPADKKAGLSRLGADMMANSVKAITYIVLVLVVAIDRKAHV